MVLYSGWLSISYSSSYYFRTCPTEEWLLITFSDRHTAKMFSCTKHLIALRWSHTCSGKLETGFFANKISINAKTAAQNSLRKITHLPVHGVKQLGSFESTWQIEDFSCKVKDSRRSGMYQSWHFWDKIGHAKSVDFRFYSAIWRSDSRISSRYLEATSITSAEREEKDSRGSGMYQSWLFFDKIGHAKSEGFLFYSIRRSESRIRPGSDAVLFMCRT